MNRRKIKKAIKKDSDVKWKKMALSSLKLMKYWEKINTKKAKINMRILTNNFYRNGKFV